MEFHQFILYFCYKNAYSHHLKLGKILLQSPFPDFVRRALRNTNILLMDDLLQYRLQCTLQVLSYKIQLLNGFNQLIYAIQTHYTRVANSNCINYWYLQGMKSKTLCHVACKLGEYTTYDHKSKIVHMQDVKKMTIITYLLETFLCW